MPDSSLPKRLDGLLALPRETEWVEFKHNQADPQDIGKYLSALSNSSVLHDRHKAWLVWGIRDSDHAVVGTSFRPRATKVKGQELEGWLATLCEPQLKFRIHEFDYAPGLAVVMFEITPCWHSPVRFSGKEYIRVGSTNRALRDYPEKESALWACFQRTPFEQNIGLEGVSGQQVLQLIDYPGLFDLLKIPSPDGHTAVLEKLLQEQVIANEGADTFNITNLGAILFAKKIENFTTLSRKAIRVIQYKGRNRVKTLREQIGSMGYAVGFERLVDYINAQLPAKETLNNGFRKELRVYPEIAIRELVANALIHQDFSVTGDGPKVEIFDDRVEITNPGKPLIETLRFVDEPPQSRNEKLAALMRRMNICEERGSGIDKTLFYLEEAHLPAPEFRATTGHTIATLYATEHLDRMSKKDRIRTCYLHACLKQVSNDTMTNESLRARLKICDNDYPKASRIIKETIEADLVKPLDPESKSRKHAKYLPFWG